MPRATSRVRSSTLNFEMCETCPARLVKTFNNGTNFEGEYGQYLFVPGYEGACLVEVMVIAIGVRWLHLVEAAADKDGMANTIPGWVNLVF